jgi:hypothetical protein
MQTTDQRYINLDYDSFPCVLGRPITIPPNVLLHRAQSKKSPTLSNKPTFYGNEKTAGHELGIFTCERSLKLYDIRYIKVLVRRILNSDKIRNSKTLDVHKTLTLALGLCSYTKQIELLKERYEGLRPLTAPFSSWKKTQKACRPLSRISHPPSVMRGRNPAVNNMETVQLQMDAVVGYNPLEPEGIRIAETTNDALVMLFLKEFFNNEVDGIIAPKLWSPYHIEKESLLMTSEVILFDPSATGLTQVEPVIIDKKNMSDILAQQLTKHAYTYTADTAMFFNTRLYTGGTNGKNNKCCDRNSFFDKVNQNVKRYSKQLDVFTAKCKLLKESLDNPTTFITNRSSIAPGVIFVDDTF